MQRPNSTRPYLPDSRFLVGRDLRGRWVVRDRKGLAEGCFSDRGAAVNFALEESGRVPGEVSCAPEGAVVTLTSDQGTLPRLLRG